jgi:hypothetical protein
MQSSLKGAMVPAAVRTPSRRAVLLLVAALAATLSPLAGARPAAAQAPGFGFYLAPPFVQTPYYPALIKDFNEALVGTESNTTAQTWTGISTEDGVTGNWRRVVGGIYGGATTVAPATAGAPQLAEASTTRSNYAAAGIIDIRLAAPASCLGFWWSAGDPNNTADFYTDAGTTLVATLTTGGLNEKIGSHLPGGGGAKPVTAIDGTVHNADSEYFGHPVTTGATATNRLTRATPTEPFAYVHAIASGGVTFDRVVLRQGSFPAPTNYGFEFDSFAVAADCTVDRSLIVIDEGLLDPDFEEAFLQANPPVPPVPTDPPAQPIQAPVRPTVTCTPDPVRPGGTVTCQVESGPSDHEILWRALRDDTFVSLGVLLGADGSGTFTFVAPSAGSSRSIAVELVGWDTATSVTVLSTAPTRIPAGEGAQPTRWWTGVLLVVVLAVLVNAGARSRRPHAG